MNTNPNSFDYYKKRGRRNQKIFFRYCENKDCGKKFQPTGKVQKKCEDCIKLAQSHKKEEKRECKKCGKILKKNNPNVFCNENCAKNNREEK